ncbi:MAG: peptide-methionine (R)-S-oxide reductase MsrB [Flavobacteriales bacterium]|nr:peptide-methionine (R)-S-oxide reductase MsrB [Flavobacteriales bacterium]
MNWADVIRYANHGNLEPDKRVEKSDEEWKRQLSAEEYRVTRQKGTEAAFSSDVCSLFEPGIYACVCCHTPLFNADEKFDSGTGWPSFTEPIKDNVIGHHKDTTYGMVRVETTCNVCDAHLGHVFPDGPPPNGLRFCMNAVALQKIEEKISSPEED